MTAMTRRSEGVVRLRPLIGPDGAFPPLTEDGEPALPEGCTVRLIDLAYGIGAAISMDEDGSINIFLNARLDRDAQRRALRHELWHYYRDDMFREADIREIEGQAPPEADVPGLLAMDGTPLARPAPVFDFAGLRRIGRGLYLPEGENLDRAVRDLRALCGPLEEACGAYDVLQRPPLVPVARLRGLCAALRERAAEALAFIAWCPAAGEACSALPVVLQFCLDDLEGALYYDAAGAVDGAVVQMSVEAGGRACRVTVDLRRRDGRLAPGAVYREADGCPCERIF